MFDQSADIYDLIYEGIRDRHAEASQLFALIRKRCPTAKSILDVACGTGERARCLHEEYGLDIQGIDIEPAMVDLARSKNPTGLFLQADMVEFDLHRTFDVVLSLFSSIGYVRTLERLKSAIASMGRHVARDGLLIIEPWFEPGVLQDGYVSLTTAERDGIWVCRMSHSRIVDRLSYILFEYLIGTSKGLRRASEEHQLGLFTREEMLGSIRSAGFSADFDPEGITGRGLYIATRAI